MFTTSPLLDGSKEKKVKKTTHESNQYTQLLDADEESKAQYQPLPASQQQPNNAYTADLLGVSRLSQTAHIQTQLPSYDQSLLHPAQVVNELKSQPVSLSLRASAVSAQSISAQQQAENALLEQPPSFGLAAVITQTAIAHEDSRQQAANIVAAFNANVRTSAVTETTMWGRGERLNPSDFLLVHRNNVPEIVGFSKYRIATVMTGPGTKVERIGKVKQNAPYFGAYGTHVINVPQGKYAKVWRGNRAVLLGEGPHVIHDATLRFNGAAFDPATDLIDQNPASNHINHGSINIVRVPPGQIAKINMNGKPYLLEHRVEPYTFNIQNFQFGGLVSQASPHIEHGMIHVVRVPQGKYAKVVVNGEAQLLKSRPQPYVFETPYFEWRDFVSQTANYIGHGNKHILRVPPGTVAKVTVDGKPMLLESQMEPYEFDTLYFNLVGERNAQGDVNCFADATSRLIINGNLKRLIPRTGEVAVTYDNGQLKIIPPSENKEPVMIVSATHDVDPNFLPIGIQTLIFPSDTTKAEKKKDNSKATEDEIAYEVFTTKDSLRVGVKLMVAYEIADPDLALRRLVTKTGILEHIENCAVVDMGKAIQRCSSQEFLSFYQTKPRSGEVKQADDGQPSAPYAEHFQDEVKNQLSSDLAEYGIKLVRLNIETPKVLDDTIAQQMGLQSIATAQASAKEATLTINYDIARTEAQQAAEVARIKAQQENSNTIAAAQAKFEATRLSRTADIAAEVEIVTKTNEIVLSKAQNDLEAAKLRAQVVKMESEAENERVRLQGKRLHDYPELLQLELAKIQFAALAQTKPVVNLNVTSEDMRNSAMMNPFMLFGSGMVRPGVPSLPLFGNPSHPQSVSSPPVVSQQPQNLFTADDVRELDRTVSESNAGSKELKSSAPQSPRLFAATNTAQSLSLATSSVDNGNKKRDEQVRALVMQ